MFPFGMNALLAVAIINQAAGQDSRRAKAAGETEPAPGTMPTLNDDPVPEPEPMPMPGGMEGLVCPFPNNMVKCSVDGNQFCEWGDYCPCPSAQVDCWPTIYDASGATPIGVGHSCAANYSMCPCAPSENRCSDAYGQWCQQGPCPCDYDAGEKQCNDFSYNNMGVPFDTQKFTCVKDISQCSCTGNGALTTPCADEWDSDYTCLASATNTGCPVTCDYNTEMMCDSYPYDSSGNPDYSADPNVSCANYSVGCPCNPTWEEKCTYPGGSYCTSILYPCPIDCGNRLTCWYNDYYANGSLKMDQWGGYMYVEKCGPVMSDGAQCPCDPDHELQCTMTYGDTTWSQCLEKVWYSSCPIDCASTNQVTCYPTGFDSMGVMTSSAAVCRNSWDDCDASCGSNAKRCDDEYGSWCTWIGDTCPVSCDLATQQECYTDEFDSNGNWVSSNKSCGPLGQACPCGSGQKKCTDPRYGESWCIPNSETCPLICTANQKYCSQFAYNSDGTMDYNTPPTESCVALNGTCPCAANTMTCTFTDFVFNETYAWCQPKVVDGVTQSCPVSCNPATQQYCGIQNYDNVGNLVSYSESCIGLTANCPCGKNSTTCKYSGYSWCEPAWDSYSNSLFSCPLDCLATQKECYMPNYDSSGGYLGTTNYCESIGTPCNCARGQNAKSCASLGDCIPRLGDNSWCPTVCPAGQVTCPQVENFDPNTGEFVSYSAPPENAKCKPTYAGCGCGNGARRCSNGECVPSFFSCPPDCTADQDTCFKVDFDVNGTVTKVLETCMGANSTCTCGANSKRCSIQEDGFLLSLCFPTAIADAICPCKASEQVCNVRDYDSKGKYSGDSIRCVKIGTPCPCGKLTKSCKDPQDPTQTTCEPKFGGESSSCPEPCTIAQELAGNKTCTKVNVDSKGKVTSKVVTCEVSCTPGRGQKACDTEAQILAGFTCKDIYKVLAPAPSGGGRRLAQIAIGSKQTSTLSFTLQNLVSTSTDGLPIKVKLDSALQMQPCLSSKLTITIKGSGASAEASLQYKVSNVGSCKVQPQAVTDQLKDWLNQKNTQIKQILAVMGTVKLGSQGCCSTTSQSKTLPGAASISTTAAAPEPEPGSESTTPTTTTGVAPTLGPPGPPGPPPTPEPASNQIRTAKGSLTMSVNDVDTYVNDANAKDAVATGIANTIGVQKSMASVDFTKLRRLHSDQETSLRRLASGAVRADYTVTLPANMAASAQQAAINNLNSMTTSTLTSNINSAMTSAGLSYSVSVTGVSAVSVTVTNPVVTTVKPGNGGAMPYIGWSTLLVLLSTIFAA